MFRRPPMVCPDALSGHLFCREDWTKTQSGLKACVYLATTWITGMQGINTREREPRGIFLRRIPHSLHSGFAYGKGLQSFASSCFWAFHCFAMDSKELSSITDCFGDKKAIKTPKLNTIWLELIVRVLNMLIGLKCDNYYSKVFKRVNYNLSNNTFWVVIRISLEKCKGCLEPKVQEGELEP